MVIGNITIPQSAYNFVFNFNRNLASVLYDFQVKVSYLSKVIDFDLPHLHLVPPLGVNPFEFCLDLQCQKTMESLIYRVALFA